MRDSVPCEWWFVWLTAHERQGVMSPRGQLHHVLRGERAQDAGGAHWRPLAQPQLPPLVWTPTEGLPPLVHRQRVLHPARHAHHAVRAQGGHQLCKYIKGRIRKKKSLIPYNLSLHSHFEANENRTKLSRTNYCLN